VNEVKQSGMRRSEGRSMGGADESLWKRFIGVVSDEKRRTGVKAYVN